MATPSQGSRLSPQQRRLWLLQSGSVPLRAQCAVLLRGPLQSERLREAVAAVTRRHEILRTVFSRRAGMRIPLQLPEEGPLRWEELDLARVSPEAQEQRLGELFREDRRRGGVPAELFSVRWVLLALAPERHALFLGLPALCGDTASLDIVWREVAAVYRGSSADLPPEPLQYADYAAWSEQLLAGAGEDDGEEDDEAAEGRAFWAAIDMEPLQALPGEHPRAEAFDLEMVAVPMEEALRYRIVEAARAVGSSLQDFLFAAWCALLGRLTGRSDLVAGRVFPGRAYEELKDAVGLFSRCLPVSVRLRSSTSFEALLQEVAERVRQCEQWEEYGVGEEDAGLEASPFPLLFETVEAPARWRMGAVEAVVLDRQAATEPFKWCLRLERTESSFDLRLAYDAACFAAADIELVAERLRGFLAAVAEAPRSAIGEVEIVTAAERWILDRDLSGPGSGLGRAPAEAAATVLSRFQEWVERSPGRPAVIFEDRALSYAQLDALSSRLARYLLRQGLAPEDRVALCLERSPEFVAAMLGVLKAGGAYVPLDPDLPARRLERMLGVAAPALVLTSEALALRLPATEIPVLRLDSEAGRIAAEEPGALSPRAVAGTLAYLMFTSGSTGLPKGVAIPHRNLLHYTEAVLRALDLPAGGEGSIFAAVSTLAADLGYTAVFPSLCSGGSLHLVSSGRATDPVALAEYFDCHPVEVLKIVPSHLEALLLGVAAERVLPRRLLVLGGEALRWPLVERVRAAENAPAIVNHYGPTETTVGILTHRLGREEILDTASVPVGKPLGDGRARLLDEHLRAVPPGSFGEVFLGGPGLARGYFADPAATAERFLPDPDPPRPGERLYRTGDLGRFHPGVGIEFAGRRDQQVKIRGFRIELGEIESCLADHPGVREAVAMVREDRPGERRLAAYFTAEPGAHPGVGELRGFLKDHLPEPMVPTVLVRLERLPLTPNGKLDRQALPSPEQQLPEGESYVGPRTPVEEVLTAIWQEVLGVARVGVHDNFFELGGDSILVIQVVARANRHGLRWAPRQFFQHQTIAELAMLAAQAAAIEVEEMAAGTKVPLTPIQHWFFEQGFPRPHHWNQALLLSARDGALDAARLAAALARVARYHGVFQLRFERVDGGWRQSYGEEATELPHLAPFGTVDLSTLPAGTLGKTLAAAAAEVQGSLDLGAGPLLRGVRFQFPAGEADRLLLVAHHLVVDGVSWRILLEDLTSVYRQLLDGGEPHLPPATTSFGSWALRLQERARVGLPAAEESWWQGESGRPWTPLPVDLDEGEDTFASREQVSLSFEPDFTGRLLQPAAAAYRAQAADLLLTALVEAFAGWTGRAALWIEAEGHGREDLFADVDLSHTVGWFTAHYPVYLDLGPFAGAGPGDRLKSVKEQLRRIPRDKTGHGILRFLGPQGNPAGAQPAGEAAARPGPGVTFNYLGQTRGIVSEGSLFALAPEHHGPTRDPEGRRRALIEVVAVVGEEGLRVTFRYSRNRHRRETVERLAAFFAADLRALVEHCCAAEGGVTPSDFPLVRLTQEQLDRILLRLGPAGNLDTLYPLTPLQEGIFFHSHTALAAGETDEYFRQYVCRIHGDLDVPAFRQVWQECVDRHPILRTSFLAAEAEDLLQAVHHRVELPFAEIDLRSFAPDERECRVESFLREERRRGFDLGAAPLMRMTLFRLGDELRQLVWSYHHLLLDGWSVALLFAEAASHYRTGHRPAEGRPFRHYIAWLQDQDLGTAERFWRDLLWGYSEPVRLPFSVSASGLGHPGKASETESVSGDLTERETKTLDSLGRSHRLTLNSLVQAAWGALLGFYGGTQDVVFGATVAGRPTDLVGFEQMVGMFINTLPVRARLDAGEPFVAYAERLHAQLVAARQYEHTPLVRVHRWSDVPRGVPLFETLVIFENYRFDSGSVGERSLEVRVEGSETLGGTNYAVAVIVKPGRRLKLRLIYDPRRIHGVLADSMLQSFQRLLSALAAAPDRPLELVALLPEAETDRILRLWNETAEANGSREDLLPWRFARQAALTPDEIAVEAGGERLSYRELDLRSRRLALALRRAGVGPDDRVAVLLERSAGLVVALLGVLRSGGAYVPLDPSHPRDRLQSILEDAAPVALITEPSGREPRDGNPAQVFRLDQGGVLATADGDEGEPWEECACEPEHLAYVMFTSGSTGRPKGVQIPHQALANLLASMLRRIPLGSGDALLAVTTIAFDIAGLEIFLPLVSGARTVLAVGDLRDPARLAEQLATAGATVMQATPATWQMLVDSGWSGDSRLRALCGGEALGRDLADHLLERTAGSWNVYGPTETTIWSTCHRVERAPEPVSIGKPVGNTEALVLDAWLRPVPPGVAGALYLGGQGLARGYHGRPDLTAAAFLPHPFSRQSGERLYRTGDQARWRVDGTLDFLGRDDHQVKIRGFRVELGEIESVLLAHPAVRQAVVVAREDSGHRRLVSYLVANSEPPPSPDELRQHLRGRLPEYMIPAHFVLLEALPLTPNGKLDRKALPAVARQEPAEGFVAPRSPAEETIAAVWAEVLRAERVGVHDNFFDLGGDSILTIRILARLHRLGIVLTPAQVFGLQTVARLAAAVAAPGASPAGLAPTEPELSEDDLEDVLAELGGFAD